MYREIKAVGVGHTEAAAPSAFYIQLPLLCFLLFMANLLSPPSLYL